MKLFQTGPETNRVKWLVVVVQCCLAVVALALGIIIELPWAGIIGLGLLAAAAVTANFTTAVSGENWNRNLIAAWVATGLALAGFFWGRERSPWEDYYAVIEGLTAAMLLAGGQGLGGAVKNKWRALGMAWFFWGNFTWLAAAYVKNVGGEFGFALLAGLGGLVACRYWFRLGAFGIQAVNTLMLLVVAFPAADLAVRFRSQTDMHDRPEQFYTYADARKNPTAYARWTRYFLEEWRRMGKDVFEVYPGQDPDYRLKPGTHGFLFQSPIFINSLGFRGPEVAKEKGDAYRIIAMGESTTFGCTLKLEDKPWPEVLEALIRERIKTRRPIQVINAGVPSYTLVSNLRRMTGEILPLHPDLIISYHGVNGFRFINPALLSNRARPIPAYRDRPLRLLGDFEYGIRLTAYKRRLLAQRAVAPLAPVPPLQTRYAQAYEELIGIAQSNHIRLALANFSMVVNRNSPAALIDFFRETYPDVDGVIEGNEIHSRIIAELGMEHPEICLINTQPNFDGEPDRFIDLVHMTQSGRQQMAETMFAGIRAILEKDLAPDGR